jgi:uncharacterized damage-inducible protein DinB
VAGELHIGHLIAGSDALKVKTIMANSQASVDLDLRRALVESYAVNERMNQMVLAHLNPAAWRAKLPGSKGRTIAAIFVHVHNVRRKWLRLSAPHLKMPAALERSSCTQVQVRDALAESGERCCEMLAEAESFRRDGWAKPWPAGAAMAAYMITHDAHHRGQVCMLAHQLGFPLPVEVGAGVWAWEKLLQAKEKPSS